MTLPRARSNARLAGETINATTIKGKDGNLRLSGVYPNAVLAPDRCGVTARGLSDDPRAIRVKLLREVFRNVG
ncbi:MAG: hypothetical protein V4516_06375 [Pseudomonadota bacterium]